MITIPERLLGKNFAIYIIDSQNANYDGVTDMISLGGDYKATIADDPEKWAEDNLGPNEVPLAFITGNKVKRHWFGKGYTFRYDGVKPFAATVVETSIIA